MKISDKNATVDHVVNCLSESKVEAGFQYAEAVIVPASYREDVALATSL